MNTANQNHRRRFAGSLLFIALFAIIGAGVSIGYRWSQQAIASNAMPERFNGVNDPSEWMREQYRNSTSDEGTIAWSKIVELARNTSSSDLALVPFVGQAEIPQLGISDETSWPNIEATERFLEQMQPVLQLIRESREVPKPVWFPMDFDGVTTLLPELQDSRSIARLLQLEALHAIYQRDNARALDAIRSLDALAQVFDWNLFTVGELVHIALYDIHCDTVRKALLLGDWNEQQLAELLSTVDTPVDIAGRWERVHKYEQTLVFDRQVQQEAIPNVFVSPEVQAALLDDYQKIIDLGKLPVDQLGWQASKLADSFQQHSSTDNGQSLMHSAMRAMLIPAIAAAAAAFERSEYTRRVTVTAIAIKQFEVKIGRWPSDLQELVSEKLVPSNYLQTPVNLQYETTRTHATLSYQLVLNGQNYWEDSIQIVAKPTDQEE